MRVRLLVVALLAAIVGVAAPAQADPPTITIRAASHVSTAGVSVRFSGSYANGGNGTLSIKIEPAGANPIVFDKQFPANDDTFEVTLALTVNTRVTAIVHGGDTGDASASWYVWVRPRIGTVLRTGYQRVGAYFVMRRGASPVFRSATYPRRPGQMCLRHQLQRYSSGAWRTQGTTACRLEDAYGRVTWKWNGSHPSGVRYRVRALFPGDARNLAGGGAWLYFRFA